MKTAELRAEKDKLKALISSARVLPPDTDSAAESMIHEYLCVAVCGRIEQDLKFILIEYARRQTEAKLDRAIARLCRNFMNPEPDKILDTIELFDRDLSNTLRSEWKDEDSLGKTIASLVGQRKRIAHQTSSSRHMTQTSVKQYFRAYEQLIERLEDHFLENTA